MAKHLFYTIIAFIFALVITFANISHAQETERFISRAKVVDTISLKAGLREITLWGVRPIKDKTSLFHVEAMDILDRLTAKGEVSCKAIAEKFPLMLARCISADGIDLGSELLVKGLVILDRKQVEGSDFASLYEEAQSTARGAEKGIWGYLKKKNEADKINDLIAEYFTDSTMLAVVGSVFGAMLLIILVAILLLVRTINIQKDEIEKIHYKEHLLKSKEKSIIISLLKSELEENKHALEAFISLYKEMLDNVGHCSTDADARDKIGKSIKKLPVLSRDTFDQHLDRLSFLNLNVINKLSGLYSCFPKKEEYVAISETSNKPYIESAIKSPIDKATNILLDLDKSAYILDLEYVLALNSVNDYKNESDDK